MSRRVTKPKLRRLSRIPLEDINAACDYIQERGMGYVQPCQCPWVKLYDGIMLNQQCELMKRIPFARHRMRNWARRWRGDRIFTVFNREDIKAILKFLGYLPVSHYYKQV